MTILECPTPRKEAVTVRSLSLTAVMTIVDAMIGDVMTAVGTRALSFAIRTF